jgi:hypothetical protein
MNIAKMPFESEAYGNQQAEAVELFKQLFGCDSEELKPQQANAQTANTFVIVVLLSIDFGSSCLPFISVFILARIKVS